MILKPWTLKKMFMQMILLNGYHQRTSVFFYKLGQDQTEEIPSNPKALADTSRSLSLNNLLRLSRVVD